MLATYTQGVASNLDSFVDIPIKGLPTNISSIKSHRIITRSKAWVFKWKHFQAQLILPKPMNHKEAFLILEWVDAMDKEFNALLANGTWELVALPIRKKTITCIWVFQVKLKVDGALERYKALLVVKGYL